MFDIYNNVIDSSNSLLSEYNKAVYVLTLSSTNGLNIGDEVNIKIRRYKYLDSSGNKTYNECNASNDDGFDIIEANGIITMIYEDRISIATNYESNIYKCSVTADDTIEINKNSISYKKISIPEDSEYSCLSDEEVTVDISSDNIIGDLSGVTFNGSELSGYGLVMNDNCYINNAIIMNSKLINTSSDSSYDLSSNRFIYLEIDEDNKEIEINTSITNYVIESFDGANIILPEIRINGCIVNIYTLNNIRCNSIDIPANSYNTFIRMPIREQLK